jgi:hypothetical protein
LVFGVFIAYKSRIIMNKQLDKQQAQSFESASNDYDYSNFEQWASEVRRQMLDSLQKKGVQREAKNQEKKLKQPTHSRRT